jgi:hypothetical protein
MPCRTVFTADRGSNPHETPFFGAHRIPRFRTNVVAYQLISPHQGTKSAPKEAGEAAPGVRRIELESAVHASPTSPLFIDELVIGLVDRKGRKMLRHRCEGCVVKCS